MTQSSADFIQLDTFRRFIEFEILKLIQNLHKEQKITPIRIREIARETLSALTPATTVDELYLCAVKLDDSFPELGPFVMKLMQEYEDKHQGKAVQQVSSLIQTGEYDKAQDLVKKVLLFKGTN